MLKVSASSHLQWFLKGLKDSFNWSRAVYLVTSSKNLQQTLLKTFALNGVVYLGILIILETFYNTPDHHLFGYSYTDLTGYPLYLICLIVNSKFYNRIAQQNTIQQQDSNNIDIVTTINTIILYGNFALFISLLKYIPVVGTVLSFFIYSIVMAYYCFEYKWVNQEWTIEQRMLYTEEHWAYCFGFGLPATSIIFFLSTLRSGGVFALIYPCYILMASVATPEPTSSISNEMASNQFSLPARVPVFFGIRYMNHGIVQFIRFVGGSKGKTFIIEKKKDNLGKLV